MTKTLETLIRLHQLTLDERRRELKAVQEREAHIREKIDALTQRLERERQAARDNPEYAPAFSRFAVWARDERKRLDRALKAIQPELEQARDRMAAAFEEKKRVEITRDNRIAAEEALRKHREQIELDELGLNRHRRQSE